MTDERARRKMSAILSADDMMGVPLSQWSIERSQDGKANIRDGDKSDTGKSWIEEDMLCDQWDNSYEGLKDCWVVYRNPEVTTDKNDAYLGAPGHGIYPFSIVK